MQFHQDSRIIDRNIKIVLQNFVPDFIKQQNSNNLLRKARYYAKMLHGTGRASISFRWFYHRDFWVKILTQ